jgi:hypothetical protein
MYATFTYVCKRESFEKLNFKAEVGDGQWEVSGMTQLRQNVRTGIPSINFSTPIRPTS